MDKIKIDDVFNFGPNNFNPLLLFPVAIVIVSAVAVFMFSLKQNEPRFKKSFPTSNNNSTRQRKKQRGELLTTTTALSDGLKRSPKQQVKTDNSKREAVKQEITKALNTPTKTRTPRKAEENSGNPSKSNKPSTNANEKVTVNQNKKKASIKLNNAENIPLRAQSDDGEWQTVTTRKQKKQIDTQPSKVDKVKPKSTMVSPKKVLKENSGNVVKSINIDIKKSNNEPQVQASVKIEVNLHGDQTLKAVKEQLAQSATTSNSETDEVVVPAAAFNELPNERLDTDWLQSKPQKKNKRRALRE